MSFLPYRNPTSAPQNYLDYNSNLPVNSLGRWITFADAAGTVPEDGIGGSPDIVLSKTRINPLQNPANYVISKPASDCQGQGVSIPFSINRLDRAKMMQIQFDYEVLSGTFQAGSPSQDSDIEVFVYDISNSQLIYVTPYKLISNGPIPETFKGVFQTASNSSEYRLILFIPTTSTSAWEFGFGNVIVSRQAVVMAPSISDWQDYATQWTASSSNPTLNNGTLISKYRRVGDSFDISIGLVVGTTTSVGSGTYYFSIPPGYEIDITKLQSANDTYTPLGVGSILNGGNQIPAFVLYHSPTMVQVNYFTGSTTTYNNPWSDTTPSAIANGNQADLLFRVPVVGIASNTVTGNDADARAVATRVVFDGTGSVPNATETYLSYSSAQDTHAAWNPSFSVYTIPVSGWYRISSTVIFEANSIGQRVCGYRLNNTEVVDLGSDSQPSATNVSRPSGVDTRYLPAGTTIEFFAFQQSGGSLNVNGFGDGNRYFHASLSKISGPALPLATERCGAVVVADSISTALPNASFAKLDFNLRLRDTHNAFDLTLNRYVVPISGDYDVSAVARLDGGSVANETQIAIYKNGSLFVEDNWSVVSGGDSVAITGMVPNCVAGDYIEIFIQNNSGGTRNTSGTNTGDTRVEINLRK